MALRLAIADEQNKDRQAPGSVFLVDQERFLIGRDEACDWTIDDPSHHISGRHCSIIVRNSEYVLQDHSTNGTFLDGSAKRVDGETTLADGARLGIGRYTISVAVLPDAEARAAAAEAARAMSQSEARALKANLSARRGGDPAETAANRAKANARREAVMTRIMPILERSSHHPCDSQPLALNAPSAKTADATAAKPKDKAPPVAPAPAKAPSHPSAASAEASVRKPKPDQTDSLAAHGRAGAEPIRAADMLRKVAAGMGIDARTLDDLDTGELLEYLGHVTRHSNKHTKPDYVERRFVEERPYASLCSEREAPDIFSLATSTVEDALAKALRTWSDEPDCGSDPSGHGHDAPDVLRLGFEGQLTTAANRISRELAPVALELIMRARDREIGRRRRVQRYDLSRQSGAGSCWRPAFFAALDRHFGDIRPVGR